MEEMAISGDFCLKHLSETENNELLKNAFDLQFEKGELIVKKGSLVQNIYFLNEGIAELFIDNKSSIQTIYIIVGGEFIGVNCVYSNDVYRFSAKALSACVVKVINKDTVTKLLTQNSKFSMAFISYISFINDNFLNWHFKLKSKNSIGALAFIILEFAKKSNDDKFTIPLTRKQLANVIGFSRESVLKNLTELRKDNILISKGSEFEIINRDKIEQISKHG